MSTTFCAPRILVKPAFLKIVTRLLILLSVALIIRGWIWSPILVTGQSMLPACPNGQLAGVNKLAYLFQAPRRGDIVAIWTGSELLLKRIVGLPGEVVSAHGGRFYINDSPLPETYVLFTDSWDIGPGRVTPDCFVVAGDNRRQTIVAVVRRERIVGRLAYFWCSKK